MPKIDNVKRITIEDVSDEAKEALSVVAQYYNYFAEQVTNILNGKIDFDNLNRSLMTIKVKLNANNQPVVSTKFAGNVGLKGINVIRVDNISNSAIYPTGGPFLTWRASGDGFYTVLHIAGLEPLNEYNIVAELIY